MAQNEYLATRLFTDRTSAEREYEALVARGYSPEDVNVLMTEEGRKRHFSKRHGEYALVGSRPAAPLACIGERSRRLAKISSRDFSSHRR